MFKTFDDVIKYINKIYSYRIILHCDKCDHEADSALGKICPWCGGNMVKGE